MKEHEANQFFYMPAKVPADVGLEESRSYDGGSVPRGRSGSLQSKNPKLPRSHNGASRLAPPPGTAFGRHGGLPGATRPRGSFGACVDAEPRSREMGQGGLRRYGHR